MKLKERLTRNPCEECLWYVKENNLCQSKKCSVQGGSYPFVTKLDKMFCETYKGEEKGMTHKDKQDVIAICNILADKMSDSGKVAVQQIIDAVKDMVEHKLCEDTISRAALLEELGEEPFNWSDSPREYQEVSDYQWFRSLVENAPSITTRKIRWISCSERLPEKYGCYLITTKIEIHDLKPYYEVRTAKFDGEHFDIGYIGNDIGVIAWMPLPERYKAENEVEE